MKKNFIVYTFIIFVLTSLTIFAEREVDFEKLEYDEKTELVYVEGEKEAFTGIAKQYYEDKSLKIEFPYKNGKLEGRGKEYYPSGKFKSDAFFVNGLLQGKSIGYYENGNLDNKNIDNKIFFHNFSSLLWVKFIINSSYSFFIIRIMYSHYNINFITCLRYYNYVNSCLSYCRE